MNLCVTVLSSLGGRHVHDLAWSLVDDDETVLSQSRTLHRERLGGASVGGLEGVISLS